MLILISGGRDVNVIVYASVFQAFRLLVCGSMLALVAPARCCGTTKSGQRCSITSSSSMRDSLGRLVADPLRRGGPFCLWHTVLFCVEPAHVCDCIVVYMDLETSSLDILSGKIVEIGALIEGSHSTFSTVVNPGQASIKSSGGYWPPVAQILNVDWLVFF